MISKLTTLLVSLSSYTWNWGITEALACVRCALGSTVAAFFTATLTSITSLRATWFAVLTLATLLCVELLALRAIRFLHLLVLDLVEAWVVPLIFYIRLTNLLRRAWCSCCWIVNSTSLAAVSTRWIVIFPISICIAGLAVVATTLAIALVATLRCSTSFSGVGLARGRLSIRIWLPRCSIIIGWRLLLLRLVSGVTFHVSLYIILL